jgi:hypothetical protein
MNYWARLLLLALFPQATIAQVAVVDFDNPAPPAAQGGFLRGEFGDIDWGSSQWRLSGPYGPNNTNSVYFGSGSGRSRDIAFTAGARVLDSLEVYALTNGTLTISDDQGQSTQQNIETGSMQSVATGWSQASNVITISFTAGWDLGLDNIMHSTAEPPPSQQFPLSVTLTGDGRGTVTSQPAGLDCGTDCVVSFERDTVVNLFAAPATGSGFDGWSGDADCLDGQVTIVNDVSCEVEFFLQDDGYNAGSAIRFFGLGHTAKDRDRLKFKIDDYTTSLDPDYPLDVGATDFTIEFWVVGNTIDNQASAVNCGGNENWINGNIILDRDRFNRPNKYGLSVAGGMLVFGVTGGNNYSTTICGSANIVDDRWHHVAIQRSALDGQLWIYVDGNLDAAGQGIAGDISYPDDAVPGSFCGPGGDQACVDSDPYLVVGAEKHDVGPQHPGFAGTIDELRISSILRYESSFQRPDRAFVRDSNTLGLFHFDEGAGEVVRDDVHPAETARDGVIRFGGHGNTYGPTWVESSAPLDN